MAPPGLCRHSLWYLIAGGSADSSRKAPQTVEQAKRCLAQWELTFRRRVSPKNATDRAAAQIISTWFQSRPDEREKIVLPRTARKFCQKLLVA